MNRYAFATLILLILTVAMAGCASKYEKAAIAFHKKNLMLKEEKERNNAIAFAKQEADFAEKRRMAGEGDLPSQLELAAYYEQARRPDDRFGDQAALWYQKAAEQGSAFAQNKLGTLYFSGKGVMASDTEAALWYQKAAEQGNADAQVNIGGMYENGGAGESVKKDEKKAAFWYKKAAAQGNKNAMFRLKNLGWDDIKAEGAVHSARGDEAGAFKVYERAANNGHPKAQNMVGLMYYLGKGGVRQDLGKALDWYRKATEQGNADAMFNLGYMYEQGLGVQQDNLTAFTWYREASEHGLTEGDRRIDGMAMRGLMGAIGNMIEADREIEEENRRRECASGAWGAC